MVFFTIACVGCALDLFSKSWIFARLGLPREGAERIWIIPDVFGFETSVNLGALFGMGQGMSWLFALLSVVFAIIIVVWLFVKRGAHDLLLTIAFGCVMAGIFGNLYDRLGLWHTADVPEHFHNGVRDWILFQYKSFVWPNFNLADSLLVSGAGLLIVHAIRGDRPAEAAKPVASKG